MSNPIINQKFKHNCPRCIYLGTIKEKGALVDLHMHAGTTLNEDSFIARYSSDSKDYTTAARAIVEQPFMVTHACRDAWRIEQGALQAEELTESYS